MQGRLPSDEVKNRDRKLFCFFLKYTLIMKFISKDSAYYSVKFLGLLPLVDKIEGDNKLAVIQIVSK